MERRERKNAVTVLAPAKLNLALDVVGLLPNGYHALDMTMQTITLYERVMLRRSAGLSLRLPGSLVHYQLRIALHHQVDNTLFLCCNLLCFITDIRELNYRICFCCGQRKITVKIGDTANTGTFHQYVDTDQRSHIVRYLTGYRTFFSLLGTFLS